MNIWKKVVVSAGIAAIVARGFWPPRSRWSESWEQMDVARLLIEWFMIALVAAGLWFVGPVKRQ